MAEPSRPAIVPASSGPAPAPSSERSAVTARQRALVWGGLAFSLLGSIAMLLIVRRREQEELWHLVEAAAGRHGLDADLVWSVVEAESSGRPEAVSRARAYGLMQVRAGTARDMAGREVSAEELFDPFLNLELGCRYLRRMLDRYGDLRLALMAYNAGPGRVDAWLAQEPDPARVLHGLAFAETRGYVRKVIALTRERKAARLP